MVIFYIRMQIYLLLSVLHCDLSEVRVPAHIIAVCMRKLVCPNTTIDWSMGTFFIHVLY